MWLYVVGTQTENELILAHVLSALHESLTSLLRGPPDKRLLLDNFDTLLLSIDEMIDSGMILETDVPSLVGRDLHYGQLSESFAMRVRGLAEESSNPLLYEA